jgi:protein TonB
MFDLVQGKVERPYRRSSRGATFASVVGHTLLITAVIVVPLLYATDSIPEVPAMMAFVVAPAATPPPPPPPPPPPAPKATAAPRQVATARPSTNPNAAPIEAPSEIKPEPPAPPASTAGQPGGVEGGIEGGVAGGIVGGLINEPAPPPPPPPPPAPARQPVRIGGQVAAPTLVHRVEPDYPAIAVAAHLEGMVILEATVGIDGKVQEVKILRSRGFLDKAAIDAVQQWQYAPLKLNGVPTPFVLTVTLNFALKQQREQSIG